MQLPRAFIIKKTFVVLALLVSILWLVVAICYLLYQMMPISTLRDILKELDPTTILPVGFVSVLIMLSVNFLKKEHTFSLTKKGLYLGSIYIGVLPLLFAEAHLPGLVYLKSYDEKFWAVWFLLILFTMPVALLIGSGVGALVGWIFGRYSSTKPPAL